MATLTIDTIDNTSITFTLTGVPIGNNVAIYRPVYGGSDKNPKIYYGVDESTLYGTITGLTPATKYSIRADMNYGGSAIWVPPLSETLTFTTRSTPLTPPTFDLGAIGTSINVVVSHVDPYSTVTIYYRKLGGSTYSTGATANSVGVAQTSIHGLSPDTTYIVDVYVDGYGYIGEQSITTELDRPMEWWWRSDVEAEAEINISASEWNDFCSRINDFARYKGSSTYSFTTVYSGDYITADIVNRARNAINSIPGHGSLPNTVFSEDYIYANFFNQLKDALNAIP